MLYRSSCRKGNELTRSGALDRWKNSLATNSPEVLVSWKSRGVKLNLPGSDKENEKMNHSSKFSMELCTKDFLYFESLATRTNFIWSLK